MSSGNPPDIPAPDPAERPFFSARLTPHRSLGPRGFLVLMLATGAICFVSGLVFLVIGAWPVFWFFGLDVLIVYVAFRINYGQARAFEEVHVSALDVRVVRVSERGAVQEFHLNPAWARLDVTRIPDEGVVSIALVSHGRSLDVGSFLNPPDRESFAAALGRALATARRGGPEPAAAPV
jgi:uncharacterized membrane protein